MSDLIQFQPVRAWDRNGVYSPGAKATFFEPGTSTPRTVYSDEALSVAHPTPLVADARGVFASAFTNGNIDVTITDADDVELPGSPLTPAFVMPAGNSAASDVSFAPTGSIPVATVQSAIERVQTNIGTTVSDLGLGLTGSAPLLANLDATSTPAGFYRFDMATTTGTPPADWTGTEQGPVWFIRQFAGHATMFAIDNTANILMRRNMASSVWGAWARVTPPETTQEDFDTGTSIIEGTISPVKLEGTINAAFIARSFTSSDQTISTAGLMQVAHGLGAVPIITQMYLVCLTAEYGYSVGDVVSVGVNAGNTAGNKYNSLMVDATNVRVRFANEGNCFAINHKTTGVMSVAANASWALRVSALAGDLS